MRSLAVNALALTGAAFTVLTPARAVTLGEVAVESRLGQPFSARVPVELAQGELLGAACVSVPAGTAPDLAPLPSPVVAVPEASTPGSYQLRVTTAQPLYEPMYELQLQVRCPGTALVVRQYVLMLDLPSTAAAQAPAVSPATIVSAGPAVAAPATAAPAAAAASPGRSARPRAVARPAEPIVGGTRYRVSEGDTLSTIAARIGGTGESLWARADRIFAANPDAFIDGNPDLIKLGSEIVIPAPGVAPAAAGAAPTPAVATADAALGIPAAPADAAAVDPLAALPPAEATVPATDADTAVAPADTAAEATEPFDPLAVDALADGEATTDAVFQDEQPVIEAPVEVEAEAFAEAAPPAVPARESGETSPWLAALVGVLVGAVVSIGLLRERLLEALRGLKPARRAAAAAAAGATAPVARHAASPESTMVVVEGHLDEDTDQLLAQSIDRTDENPAPVRPAAKPSAERGGDPASDLSRLFDDPPAAAVSDDLVADLPAEADLDLDLSAATPDVTIDQEIGWIGDDTALTPTQESPTPHGGGSDTVEQLDLQTLSQRATSDTQVSQTLEEALNLLESDYEDELTASQVIDRKKLEQLLDDDPGEDTLVRTGTDQIPRR